MKRGKYRDRNPTPEQNIDYIQNSVEKNENGCWEWQRARIKHGYGRLWEDGRRVLAHRFSWEVFKGKIPEGLFICHHCDNPPCVNPEHLFLGTYQDNADDSVRKWRSIFGEKNGSVKLTDNIVREIYNLRKNGTKNSEIASKYGIDGTTVSAIALGRAWKHLKLKPLPKDPQYKLNEHDVLKIIELYKKGLKTKALSEKFGVRDTMITRIVAGKRWQSVTGIGING